MRGRMFIRWSSLQERDLVRLWAEGLTGSAIAARLGDGITRSSAVLGKVHRMQLPPRRVEQRQAYEFAA